MRVALSVLLGIAMTALSCGGGSSNNPPPTPISLSIDSQSLSVGQDGTSATVTVTVTCPTGDTNSVTLTASGVPSGVNTQIVEPGTGNSGTVTFTPQTTAGPPAGTYSVTLRASDGNTSASASLSLVVAIVATVQPTVNTRAGQGGALNTFMSTSFQPAEWDYEFFTNNSGATTTLGKLQSRHIRLQPVSQGTPQKTDQSWDFSTLDAILNPVISVADNSPELQLAVAPAWMDDSNGHLQPSQFPDFAAYTADLVQYYNTATGFTDSSGKNHVHSASNVTPVTWWGVFNEPNINGLDAVPYT